MGASNVLLLLRNGVDPGTILGGYGIGFLAAAVFAWWFMPRDSA